MKPHAHPNITRHFSGSLNAEDAPQIPVPHALFLTAIAFVAGAALGAWTLSQTTPPPEPLPAPRTIVVDCINIQHAPPAASYPADHEARYALIRLQRACEQQENALALMQIWEKDPSAGAVLEPE